MFKKIKKGKMLEINEMKPTACGGTVNTGCKLCTVGGYDSTARDFESYEENKEYWGGVRSTR